MPRGPMGLGGDRRELGRGDGGDQQSEIGSPRREMSFSPATDLRREMAEESVSQWHRRVAELASHC